MFSDRVEKYGPAPQAMARKYAAIERVGRDCGFVAPKVLAVNDDHIVLERLDGIVSLRHLYMSNRNDELNVAVRTSGGILAHIHRCLQAESAALWQAPADFRRDLLRFYPEFPHSSLPRAILHCDFSFANIFVLPSSPTKLAVIDPCPNFASTHDVWTDGPVYLDIGKMLSCLEGQVAARHQLRRPSPARVNELQNIFLEAYAANGSPVDRRVAHAFAFATASCQFRRRFGILGALHRIALYSRLRGNFPLDRKLSS